MPLDKSDISIIDKMIRVASRLWVRISASGVISQRISAANSKVCAYLNIAQTLVSGNSLCIPFDVDSGDANSFDTNNEFDTTVNKGRFTATRAGYYHITAHAEIQSTANRVLLFICKNGSGGHRVGMVLGPGGEGEERLDVSGLAYLNGTTDYLEVFAYQDSGGPRTLYAGAGVCNVSIVEVV